MKILDRLDALRVPWRVRDGKLRLAKGAELPEWLARLAATFGAIDNPSMGILDDSGHCDVCRGVVLNSRRLSPQEYRHWWCAPTDYYMVSLQDNTQTRVTHIQELYRGLQAYAENGLLKRLSVDGSLTDAKRVVARIMRDVERATTWEALHGLECDLREFAVWEPWGGGQ